MQSLFKSALPAKQPDDCRTTNDLLLTFIYKQGQSNLSIFFSTMDYIYNNKSINKTALSLNLNLKEAFNESFLQY